MVIVLKGDGVGYDDLFIFWFVYAFCFTLYYIYHYDWLRYDKKGKETYALFKKESKTNGEYYNKCIDWWVDNMLTPCLLWFWNVPKNIIGHMDKEIIK